MIRVMLLSLVTQQSLLGLMEFRERNLIFRQARDYADSLGKPLLVVGTPKFIFNHPCGDVTIDIDPDVASPCEYDIVDVRQIPYPDKTFGAAFASHIIEHLPTIADAEIALNELHRVADKTFVVSPSKASLVAWLHPEHHLWVTSSGDGYVIEQRGVPRSVPESFIVGMRILK